MESVFPSFSLDAGFTAAPVWSTAVPFLGWGTLAGLHLCTGMFFCDYSFFAFKEDTDRDRESMADVLVCCSPAFGLLPGRRALGGSCCWRCVCRVHMPHQKIHWNTLFTLYNVGLTFTTPPEICYGLLLFGGWQLSVRFLSLFSESLKCLCFRKTLDSFVNLLYL